MPAALLPLLGLGIATGALGLGAKHLQQRQTQKAQQQRQAKIDDLLGQGGMNFSPQQQALFQIANMPGMSPAIQGGFARHLFGPAGLSPSDQLAREKFEYQKQQDASKPVPSYSIKQNPYGRGGVAQVDETGKIINYQSPRQTKAPDWQAMSGMRKEFLKETQGFRDVQDAVGRVRVASAGNTPADDVALVFAYMKVLDPGSVVREGEFATAQNTGSVPERVWNMYNRALKGDRLTPNQRKNFSQSAENIAKDQGVRYDKKVSEYSRLATGYGFDPSMIVPDLRVDAPSPATPTGGSGADPNALTDAQLVELLKSKGYDARAAVTLILSLSAGHAMPVARGG